MKTPHPWRRAGPAGSEWGPGAQLSNKGASAPTSGPPRVLSWKSRAEVLPTRTPLPCPRERAKSHAAVLRECGVSAETMKLGGAQTRRCACFLTTCQQRGEARLPTTAPRVVSRRKGATAISDAASTKTTVAAEAGEPLGRKSPPSHYRPKPRAAPRARFPGTRARSPWSLTFLAFHSGAPLPARGSAGVSRGQERGWRGQAIVLLPGRLSRNL